MSAERPTDPAATSHEDLKPGAPGEPPKHASTPPEHDHEGAGAKTQTNPHTGEPSNGRSDTAGAG